MIEDEVVQIERLKLFSNAMLIKSLCSAKAFERMQEIRDRVLVNNGLRMGHVVFGYKLVVQSGLWGLLDHLIRFPELLGLKGEPHLHRWWRIVQGEDGLTLKAAICDPYTDFARVVSGIDDLVIAFRQAGVSWDHIAEANEAADQLSDELLDIARSCPVSYFTDARSIVGLDRILQASTVDLIHESWIAGINSSAFRYGLRKPTEWKQMELPGQSMFDVETHRDDFHMFPEYDPTKFEPGWAVGKLSAVIVSLQETNQWRAELGDPHKLLQENSDPSQAWAAGNRILEGLTANDPTEFEFGLKHPPALPARVLPSLSAPVSLANSGDRLVALFGRQSILIGSRDSRGVLYVETIAAGLACTLPDDSPIDILRIVHGSEAEVNPVSLAVLMPLAGAFSDSSEWWVFDRVYRVEGVDPSSDQRISRINGIVEGLGKYVNWIHLNEVPVERLLSLCDYHSFQRLLSQFKDLETVSNNIRGAIPELLSAQLLSKAGYHPVVTSLEVTFPSGEQREIDVVGIRLTSAGADCKIVEVKGRSDSRYPLEHIHRFNETVQLANTHRSVIQKVVGCSEAIQSVSGLFISMAKGFQVSEDSEQLTQPAIEYWNYGRFVAELRKAGYADRYIDLLQESLVVWENGFRESLIP